MKDIEAISPYDGFVEADGLRLHYLDWGNQTAPAMLLLHGTASHAHVWDRFAASMRRDFHVIALDQRGFGDSEWPVDYRTGYEQRYWASDIKAVAENLRLVPMVLIGISTGANNAMHFSALHQEYVDRLVIVEMGPEVQSEGVDRVRRSIPTREEFDGEEEAVAYLTGPGGRADPALARAHALHSVLLLDDGRVTLKGDPSLRRRDWRRPLHSPDENWAAALKTTCPTLVVRGAESRLLSAAVAQRMQNEMANCTLITIAGAGHAVPLHRPVEFEQAVSAWLGAELVLRKS